MSEANGPSRDCPSTRRPMQESVAASIGTWETGDCTQAPPSSVHSRKQSGGSTVEGDRAVLQPSEQFENKIMPTRAVAIQMPNTLGQCLKRTRLQGCCMPHARRTAR
eukprot:scaffold127425_cov31-Tisochrysis_lutea.AAC.2